MISACIVSPAWRRFDVTRLVLDQRRRLCVELASRGVDATMLIAADDENLDIAAEYGCETVWAHNKPLGQKCNLLFKAATAREPDYIVWVGSDDWIHSDIFEPLLAKAEHPPTIFSGHKLAIVDLHTGKLQRIASPAGKFGSIPWIIDARLFRLHPKLEPIRRDLGRGLDGALVRGLRRSRIEFEWVFTDPHDFRCVDFKSDRNLTPYDGLARNLGVGDPERAWQALAAWYPVDLIAKARRLSEELA